MNKLNNIVDLDEFRKKRTEENKLKPHHLKAFEPDQYYIHPELGLMIHVLFVTDKSYHYKNEPVYVMEDQYGNFFADTIEEDTCRGWHELFRDVFIKAVKDLNPDNDPSPRIG